MIISKATWKAIFILPFNVLVIVPALLIYYFEDFSACRYISLCLIAFAFLIIGINLLTRTIILLDKIGKGTLAPWSPTKQLVVTDPYKYIRSPMNSGVILILIAEILIFTSFYILIEIILFFVINTFYFKLMEEVELKQKFGTAYTQYKKTYL